MSSLQDATRWLVQDTTPFALWVTHTGIRSRVSFACCWAINQGLTGVKTLTGFKPEYSVFLKLFQPTPGSPSPSPPQLIKRTKEYGIQVLHSNGRRSVWLPQTTRTAECSSVSTGHHCYRNPERDSFGFARSGKKSR